MVSFICLVLGATFALLGYMVRTGGKGGAMATPSTVRTPATTPTDPAKPPAGAPPLTKDPAPTPKDGTPPTTPVDMKAVMAQGEMVYSACSICHGFGGEGQEGQVPSLIGSRRALGSERTLARIMIQGLDGPLESGGKRYAGSMPPPPVQDDADLAAVMTYIRNSWGNKASAVSPELVASVRKETISRLMPWTAEELDKEEK